MNFSQFLLALRARRKAFLLVLVSTIVVAVGLALVLPKRYTGVTTVLVDMRDPQQLGPEGRALSSRDRAAYVQTQVDLIQSGRVARKVSHDLRLAQRPGVRADFESDTGGEGNIEDWIASQLLLKLKVDVSGSNVITVQYSAPTAQDAAEIANGFAQAYLDTVLQLRTEPNKEAAVWFKDQLRMLRNEVTQAQARLTAYQKAKGITTTEERSDIEAARLSELSTQLMTARNATYDAEARYRQAKEVLASGTPDALPEIMSNGVIATVRADLTRAEAALQAASADLGPNHPAYKRAAADVEAQRAKLRSEMQKVVAALGNAAQQAKRREQELAEALAAQNKRLLAQKDYRVEMATLTRDVETTQRAYDAALTRMVAAQVDSRANQTTVDVLTPATVPLVPAFPRMGLVSILAVVIGLMLAAGVVFLLETLDHRVRSREDLESRLAVPTLGRLSRWTPSGALLLPAPARASRALPNPW